MAKALLFKSSSASDVEYSRLLSENNVENGVVDVLAFKMINKELLRDKMDRFEKEFDGLVVTSPRAIEALQLVWNRLDETTQSQWLKKRAWVVGSRSGNALKQLMPSLVIKGPESGSSKALLQLMLNQEETGSIWLFPCGNLALEDQDNSIAAKSEEKLRIEPLVCYETCGKENTVEQIADSIEKLDMKCMFNDDNEIATQVFLVFFSPSCLQFSLDALKKTFSQEQLAKFKCIALGPSTEGALKNCEDGLKYCDTADKPSPSGLLSALKRNMKEV